MANSPSKPPAKSQGVLGTLGTVAVAVGVGVLGAYMLDLHSHTCERCGRRWRHLGAFNLGDEASHTCSRCGQVQWWKCGAPHVLRGSEFYTPPSPLGASPTLPLTSAPEVPSTSDFVAAFAPAPTYAPPPTYAPAPTYAPPPASAYAPVHSPAYASAPARVPVPARAYPALGSAYAPRSAHALGYALGHSEPAYDLEPVPLRPIGRPIVAAEPTMAVAVRPRERQR